MSWLITGGCGFIGLRLIERLLNSTTDKIYIIDNQNVGTFEDLLSLKCNPRILSKDDFDLGEKRIGFLDCDIRDQGSYSGLLKNVTTVIHLAANTGVQPSLDDPKYDFDVNISGTISLLEACRTARLDKFIFASSGAPLGDQEPPLHEGLAPRPTSPYGASKLAGEGYCSAYYHSFGINTLALRFGNVYGPGSFKKSSIVAKFLKSALEQRTFEVYGDGEQTRDYIYVEDLVDALLAAARSDTQAGEVFQIATSKETSVNEIIELLSVIFRSRQLPEPTIKYGSKRIGDMPKNFSNTTKAYRALGWKAKTELNIGLTKTVSYFMEREGLK